LGAAQADLDAVEAIVRGAGTSFYRGMRVLPPDRRHAMYAIYAFCRVVDDIADDEAVPLTERLPKLSEWRDRIIALFQGITDGPVTRVLAEATRRYALRQEDFLAVIDGMQMDAETPIVAPDLGTCVRRRLGGSGSRRACARPRAAAHQHPARCAGGCRARPAVLAA
jgi:phytoene synthase